MRAQRITWIMAAVVALIIILLALRPDTKRVSVQILGVTNAPTPYYVVRVANDTDRPHQFTAWTEFSEDDGATWYKIIQGAHSFSVLPRTFVTTRLPKAVYERLRIALACYPQSINMWDRCRDKVVAFIGIKSRRVYYVYFEIK